VTEKLRRLSIYLSLTDPTVPDLADYGKESDREIDRHTLTGAWDSLFVALLRERCHRDGLGEEHLADSVQGAHQPRRAAALQACARPQRPGAAAAAGGV
jgi:DNA sulfur modification protein DndE